MKNKVVLITGATNGIGKVTALELARLGTTVVIAARSQEKAIATVQEIKQATGNQQIDYLLADLSVMAEVRRLAEEFKQKYARLDVLINNAGATFTTRQETIDGYEKTFATNHLAYFLLTNLLLDRLKASAPSRIVNVASVAHGAGRIDFDDLQNHRYDMTGFRAYSSSKLANMMFTYELARRLEGTGIKANVMNPGVVASNLGNNNGFLYRMMMRVVWMLAGLTPEQGADTIIYLASSPDVEGISGKYWEKRKAIPSSNASHDEQTQKRLWEISEQMTKIVPNGVL